jgi:hypothetical protein
MDGNIVEIIDLGVDLQTELQNVGRLSKCSAVFLSFAQQDREVEDLCRA